MKKLVISLFLLSTMLTSCYHSFYPQTGAMIYPETYPENIKIYYGDIDQEYIIIGSITADVVGDADAVVKYLKKKAAELGADAIIRAELNIISSETIRTGISGVAIKLKAS